ncbi:MAG: hypothetical protein A2234_10355 [Elusimicrobia bacterium RIFOXYA2_FULL_58_8]|nr:MAG: hypothetical protein A2285_04320 [Elusimicrobia bacterium RIFOXYA12_FULL_57_11]OGS14573.1 MAG: hypothetical protein A2234_10355 [Elusimicrobia bacterium RIFOXYA2_FULL_58_8]
MAKYRRRKLTLPAALPAYCLLVCFAFCACGPRYDDAAELARQGRALSAAQEYARFSVKNPRDPRAPAALLAAARLYALNLGLCAQARPLLERLARNYPKFKVPPADFRLIFVCPEYFPARAGRAWTYGDSQTFGRNASQKVTVTGVSAAAAEVRYALYAGKELVSRNSRSYFFSEQDLYEKQGGFSTLLLSYPLEKGKTWQSRAQEGRLEFRVEATGLTVKVKAGVFANCVKVRRGVPGRPSWIFDYYAPWTGRVATSVAGKGYENRVMELLSYEEKK